MVRATVIFAIVLAVLAGCAAAPTACMPAMSGPSSAPPSSGAASAPVSAAVPATAATSDAAMSMAIVGSWIVPFESSDYRRKPAREEYRGDGTYTLYYYDSPACEKITGQIDASWRIENGILLLQVVKASASQFVKVGQLSRDQIITLEGNTMTLHAMNDGMLDWSFSYATFLRKKAEGCYDPGP